MAGALRVGAVQFQHRADDKAYNLARIRHFVGEAAADGVQIIAFPEMCITGYWHVRRLGRDAIAALAETIPGPSTDAVAKLARERGMAIGAGLIERGDDGRFFNAYAVFLPDGSVHVHRKLHAFENEAIASGDRYTVFDTPFGVKAGVLICWDNNLVENVRATALLGADILIAPHQTGGCDSRSPFGMKPIDPAIWRRRGEDPAAIEAEFRGDKGRGWLMRWLPARAHDNGLFLVFSNGVGEDDGEVRTGNAMVIDPYGRIVAETSAAADALVVADCDLSLLPLSTGRRWIRGRRPELYSILTERQGYELDPRAARFSAEPVDLAKE